jgi:hypothetical protein
VIAVASSQRNRGLSHQIPSVAEIRYGKTQGLITLLRQMQKWDNVDPTAGAAVRILAVGTDPRGGDLRGRSTSTRRTYLEREGTGSAAGDAGRCGRERAEGRTRRSRGLLNAVKACPFRKELVMQRGEWWTRFRNSSSGLPPPLFGSRREAPSNPAAVFRSRGDDGFTRLRISCSRSTGGIRMSLGPPGSELRCPEDP